MNYATIFTYSFDPETVVHLFKDEESARDFLRKSYQEELRIDTQENGFDSDGHISEDGWYASIVSHFDGHDDITEFRIGCVHEDCNQPAVPRCVIAAKHNWIGQKMKLSSEEDLMSLFREISGFRETGTLEGEKLRALEKEFSDNVSHTPHGECMRLIEESVLFEISRRFYNQRIGNP